MNNSNNDGEQFFFVVIWCHNTTVNKRQGTTVLAIEYEMKSTKYVIAGAIIYLEAWIFG